MKKLRLILTSLLLLLAASPIFAQFELLWNKFNGSVANDIIFFKDANYLITANKEYIEIDDVETGNLHNKLYFNFNENGFTDLDISPDGKTLASLVDYNTLVLWDLVNETALDTIKLERTGYIKFSNDGNHLFLSGGGGLWIYDIDKKIKTKKESINGSVEIEIETMGKLSISKDGKYFVVSVGGMNKFTNEEIRFVELWDAKSFMYIKNLDTISPAIADFSFSDDGRRFLLVDSDNKIRIWNTLDFSLINTYNSRLLINQFFFLNNNDSLIFSEASKGIVNINTDQMIYKISNSIQSRRAALSSDNKYLALGGLWDNYVFKVSLSSIEEIKDKHLLFPNPIDINSILNIPVPPNKEIIITLFDINAKRISELFSGISQDKELQFDLNNMSITSGIYFLNIASVDNQFNHQIIIR